jgi:hypothetical protein
MERIFSVNLDANESMFFARELETVKARTYDIVYPEYKATLLIPVSTEAGPGAEAIVYRQFDQVGVMKIIANYADDLPRADVKGAEFVSPVRSIGGSFGYNIQEIRAAQQAGRPINQRRAAAVRQAYEQTINKIAWFARTTDAVYGGLQGLLYNANITKSSPTYGAWISTPRTAAEILIDMNKAIQAVITLTKGVEIPDTLLLPLAEYGHINTMPRSTNSDLTVLEYFKRNNPGVMVEWVNEIAAVDPKPSGGAGPTNLMIAYKRSPDKLTLEIPSPFEQFAAQERNLEFVVPAHGRIGGVIVYYPLSINIVEGI